MTTRLVTEHHVATLTHLRAMLIRYTPAYYRAIDAGRLPSSRLLGWIDAYNDARAKTPEAWTNYCTVHGSDPSHNAYDLFA